MKRMMSVAELKKHFSEVLESILYLGDRFVVLKRGRPVAAIVSMKELSELEENSQCSARGLVVAAGAWSDYEDIDKLIENVYQARITAKDREVKME
ncbi:MAG: type II toxin-antitoxin system Phd/YefM family antitoxin [Candidatus Xenobiia bacterium LiM19]